MATSDSDTTDEAEPTPLTAVEICRILTSERRQVTVEILAEEPVTEPIDFRSLAELVAQRETGNPDPRSSTVKQTYVSLYQTHLLRLEGVGAVEIDSEDGIITPTKRITILAKALTCVKTHGEIGHARSWRARFQPTSVLDRFILRRNR